MHEKIHDVSTSNQERHLLRYVMRYVKVPDYTEYSAYLAEVAPEITVNKVWYDAYIRAEHVVPWLCRQYAALGPCRKRDILRAKEYL